ncbi:MAG TPA: twin-arginine translocation signal domain-containing protein [Steroidobacteraceae bacterium]|jgi:hypothetical protein
MRISATATPDPKVISRRRFLYGAGALVALVAVVGWLKKSARHSAPGPSGTAAALAPAVAFLGALFGRELSDADRTELTDRLAFAVRVTPGLSADYEVLARQLDRLARDSGGGQFLKASSAQREAIIDRIMRIEPPSLAERAWAHFVRTRKRYYHMRFETVPQLAWLYRHSGVPWRARGYARWQGIPGDWREYTRAGAPYP